MTSKVKVEYVGDKTQSSFEAELVATDCSSQFRLEKYFACAEWVVLRRVRSTGTDSYTLFERIDSDDDVRNVYAEALCAPEPVHLTLIQENER